MSFYNPYMKGPDFGAGISGAAQNIIQMLLLKKFMGGGQKPLALGMPTPGAPTGQTTMPQNMTMQMPGQDESQLQMFLSYLRSQGLL